MNFVTTQDARLSEAANEPFQLSADEEDYLYSDILSQVEQGMTDAGRISLQTWEH